MRCWALAFWLGWAGCTGQAQSIRGEEIVKIVQQALHDQGIQAPAIAAPIRDYPECAHTPRISGLKPHDAVVEIRCLEPRPWRRLLRLDAPLRGLAQQTTHQPMAVPQAEDAVSATLVATRPLVRGQRIALGDVRLSATSARQGARLGVLDSVEAAQGRRLRVSLMPDQPVLERHLDPDYVVAVGDEVAMHLVAAGIEIGMSATALENGWQDDLIQVRPAQSGRVVTAVIVGPGRVQVRPNIAR